MHSRLLMAGSLLLFCVGCQTIPTPPEHIDCPRPNTAEIDDYALIVESSPDRHAVRWISRMIAYCWPGDE